MHTRFTHPGVTEFGHGLAEFRDHRSLSSLEPQRTLHCIDAEHDIAAFRRPPIGRAQGCQAVHRHVQHLAHERIVPRSHQSVWSSLLPRRPTNAARGSRHRRHDRMVRLRPSGAVNCRDGIRVSATGVWAVHRSASPLDSEELRIPLMQEPGPRCGVLFSRLSPAALSKALDRESSLTREYLPANLGNLHPHLPFGLTVVYPCQ